MIKPIDTVYLSRWTLKFSDKLLEKQFSIHQMEQYGRMSRAGLFILIGILLSFHLYDIFFVSFTFYINNWEVYVVQLVVSISALIITFSRLYDRLSQYLFIMVIMACAYGMFASMYLTPEESPFAHMTIIIILVGFYIFPTIYFILSLVFSLVTIAIYAFLAHTAQYKSVALITNYLFFMFLIQGLCFYARYKYDQLTRRYFLATLMQKEHRLQGFCRYYNITSREREILKVLFDGMQIQQIAQTLVIAPETVRKHLQNIYNKTDTHSRLEALALFNAFFS